MKKLNYSDWMAVSVVLFFFGIMSFWMINDVMGAQTTIINNYCSENITYGVTNGFWQLDNVQAFHIGLIMGLLVLITLLLIIVHLIFMAGEL